MRVRKLFVIAGLIAAVVIASIDVVRTASRRNIVVIMLDDVDVDSIKKLLAKGMMPYFKHYFVDAGYNFTESYAVGTLGSPSRASFLTGQYPHNHHELGSDPIFGGAPQFNQSSTIATWLRTSGYNTAAVGRYLFGYGVYTSPTFIPPGWDFWAGLVDPSTWSVTDYSMNINGSIVDFGEMATAYQTELHQTDMISYLSGLVVDDAAPRPEPFFMVVTPTVFNREIYPSPTRFNVCPDPPDPFWGGHPHGAAQKPPERYMNTIFGNTTDFPLPQPPNFNEANVSDKPIWVQNNPLLDSVSLDCLQKRYWRRLEGMRAIDDLVGNVMWRLESAGVLNNTIVFFTADNGWSDGQHRFADKTTPYEESIRVPLYVRPATTIVPRDITRMVLNTDLAPTIAAIAGATPTHVVDGRSLVPLLQNPDLSPWRRLGFFQFVVASSSWQVNYPPNYLALRTASPTPRLFVRYPTVTTPPVGELYDLAVDPYELQNLYGTPARAYEQGRLQTWLDAMKTCAGLTCTFYEQYFTF